MTIMDRAKPFCIAKREVWEAYKQVKANRCSATRLMAGQRQPDGRPLRMIMMA
jgi:hypothetical protein